MDKDKGNSCSINSDREEKTWEKQSWGLKWKIVKNLTELLGVVEKVEHSREQKQQQ
jgi:hypothetical protein